MRRGAALERCVERPVQAKITLLPATRRPGAAIAAPHDSSRAPRRLWSALIGKLLGRARKYIETRVHYARLWARLPRTTTTAQSEQMRAALARAARLRGVGVAAAATVTTASCAERRACPGFEVPLDRRYKGTAAAREARGRGCLTDAEVVQCAEIINNFVDLPFFTEEQEQEIFEFSVCRLVERLAQVLPNEVINMIHSDQSLPRLPAAELEKRLHAWLVDTWQMPLLDELDRRHVVHCLLVLVRA